MGRIDLNEISDDRKYQDVALLIDREDFQRDLQLLRNKLSKSPNDNWLRKGLFKFDLVARLLSKYSYPPGFSQAILSAAESNKVTDKDVESLYTKSIYYPILSDKSHPIYPENNVLLISIYPYLLKGKQKSILSEIEVIIKSLKKNKLFKPLPKNHALTFAPIRDIRNQREMFWFNQDLKYGYRKLSTMLKVKLETVKSQIKSYRKRL